jgi:hypothetical protein
VTALAAAAARPVPGGLATGQPADLAHVVDDPACARDLGPEARRLAGLLDPGFLAGAGWDPVRLILEVPGGHRLLAGSSAGSPAASAAVTARNRSASAAGSGWPLTAWDWTRWT